MNGGSSCDATTLNLRMTKPALTDEDYSDLAALVRETIEAEPYRIGGGLLAKLDPASTKRAITPYPPPREAQIRALREQEA